MCRDDFSDEAIIGFVRGDGFFDPVIKEEGAFGPFDLVTSFYPEDVGPFLGKKGGIGRSYADAPEIDGVVRLLPPEKISKTLKVGEFTRARIVGTQGHDLVALPI